MAFTGGYTDPLIAAVGSLWTPDDAGIPRQYCTGTLIARGVVLTAGHCVYSNGEMLKDVAFYPGSSWATGTTDFYPTYGGWRGKSWWVPRGWVNGDRGMDWGLIELYPNEQGLYPGDDERIGSWTATANIRFVEGGRLYVVGYPSAGVFAQLNGGYGQVFCDTDTKLDWTVAAGSNVFLSYECTMSRGASGGPVFVQLRDDSWTIGGVVNQAYPNGDYPTVLQSAYFDNRLLDFYHSVFG